MNIKIFLIMILLIISINNVTAYEVFEGDFSSQGESQTTNSISPASYTNEPLNAIGITEGTHANDLTSVTVLMPYSAWSGTTTLSYQKSNVTYLLSGNPVGTGYVYYWLQNTDSVPGYDYVYVKAYIDNGLNLSSGYHFVEMSGTVISHMRFDRLNSFNMGTALVKSAVLGKQGAGVSIFTPEGTHKAFHSSEFYNNYSYFYNDNEELFNFQLNRDVDNQSMLYIDNEYVTLINESSYNGDVTNIFSDDLVNHTWNIEVFDINSVTHNLEIDFIPLPEIASIEFNQSTYYINETMKYEYAYLNKLHTNDKYYDLVFYYYTSDDTIEYLYIQPLSDYSNIGYLSTYGWYPKKLYYGVIDNSINYKTSYTNFLNNVKLSNYVNLTYNYEFVYTSCTGDYCQYTNGDTFIITYNSFDNYLLNVSDNNSNIVNSLGNINGFGTISYTIPYDNEKQYTYPIWNISFNNSYNNIHVFWNMKEEDEEYPTNDVNETIQNNIDEMREGFKPLFDLAFGVSTIVVDNPDYDENGITSSSELDRWFNSIISLVILIALYIFYKGLKDKR